ncbi:hypothetical protein ACFYW9_19170 [Streptomyces sp. NPDC002698]|uniref:hypothetical protein n=1 Tax=Streptomyces sp. NPDC002698 TaxID=3364660 RepID=UPI0036A7F69A
MRTFIRRLMHKLMPNTVDAHAMRFFDLGRIIAAAGNLDDEWGRCVAVEAAGHFTCPETDALVELLRAVGLSELANAFLEGHAHSDFEDDDPHHDLYLELNADLIAA